MTRLVGVVALGSRRAERDVTMRLVSAPAAAYDKIGVGYRGVRETDPVLAGRIWDALGDAQTVVNVGAGAGAYEPMDRWVLAVEPSRVMLAQRSPSAAPALCACAESLPLADKAGDAALGVLSIQHWTSVADGLSELCRLLAGAWSW